jgi:hypothetical protein
MKYLFLIIIASCSTVKSKTANPIIQNDRIQQLSEHYTDIYNEAIALSNGSWITGNGCDGMLYSGLSGAAGFPFDLTLAEYGNSGRFGRRPAPDCWNETDGDVGSKTTWSRDMSLGLAAYLWRTQDLTTLMRHIAYGNSRNWKMGEPSDNRVFYTPQIIGMFYQIQYALGGANNGNRNWPSIYPNDLTGYQVNLLLVDIWIRGEIDKIDEHMYSRIVSYMNKDPKNTLAKALYGIYSGDFNPAIDNCLKDITPDHVGDERRYQLAYLLFSCDLVLRKYK